MVIRDCSEADDEMTELEDTEVEAGHKRFGVAEMNPNPRPSGNYEFLESPVKTMTDAVVVESDHKNFSEKKGSELETETEDSEAIDDAELWDRDEEVYYEGFGVAEIKEISEDGVGTSTSAENEGQQVEWSR